ncbi:ectonucleoside triphosphate diphosphohydrolase 6 [Hyla sarda]|uniref:ectonucleoside triphosphate diphosphohydrolase 6 n=1 Tax=Hyla sarda TaxID=327740 RepID=UPI0024C3F7F1|nr:ectonucleoside triphosphate diphosphohydrolase 6 [Hyla sarda]
MYSSESTTMKISKIPFLLFVAFCVMLYVSYLRWNPNTEVEKSLPNLKTADGSGRIAGANENFYGIMFDAGSTGTRVHVYKFSQTSSGAPRLEHELFKAIKPGLSAYADEPHKCSAGIQELLDIAIEEIPEHLRSSTPLILKATAGLRLLPEEKAQRLLDTIKDIFQSSPFLVGKESVSIMDGTDEGIFAWITVNFLTGNLTKTSAKLAGMLDLGGGSTQITFYPYEKTTFTSAPAGYITNFQLFNRTFHLYSHSYLGLGLMSARLQIMGGVEGKPLPPDDELVTPCITPGFVTDFKHAGITYKVKGQSDVKSLYESCYKSVAQKLAGKVNLAKEVENLYFYAFSYYFDRAEDTQLIDPNVGGFLKVSDFEMAAMKECARIQKAEGRKPYLCMDLTYITHLLQDLGFSKDKPLKLVKKINDVETSWALGATFYYMDVMKNSI